MQIVRGVVTKDLKKVRATLEQVSRLGRWQGAAGKVYLDAAGDRSCPDNVA
ncbi:MAG: hypothetical protein ACO2PM_09865 [Pyrobaculum sp.]